MRQLLRYVVCFCSAQCVVSYKYCNKTTVPAAASQQLFEFRQGHSKPMGIMTKVTGEPLDVRDTITLNSELFDNRNLFRLSGHHNRERIPQRIVHAKGSGAFGYFEVTQDVSKYTKADVFNGIGKRTPVMARFSLSRQKLGGTDMTANAKAMSLKLYTKEGNLDLICFHIPIFFYKDPNTFGSLVRAFINNPRTGLFDNTMPWDIINLKSEVLHSSLWTWSDIGLPDGYRKSNYFPLHIYEIYNKYGESYFVKFNFRTELGLFNLTNHQAAVIGTEDPDYFNRDLYNAIAANNYPSWILEMDILTKDGLYKVDYDPFDMTRLWKRGTYSTVTIGRLVMNRRVDNHFRDTEQSAFAPDNLVPGIAGPHDDVFRSRTIFYPDTQNYRLGVNHANIPINMPLYAKTYSRDGVAPVLDNMNDAPNYYPNSFNGPMPYIDKERPKNFLKILHSNTVDLQPLAEFYNEILESDEHRQRLSENVANSLLEVTPHVVKDAFFILTLIDVDFGRRVSLALATLKGISRQERIDQYAQCFAPKSSNTAKDHS